MADTKKEYTSNLHPKGDMDTTVYPNVKSENIIDKDTTAYNAGKVPDSSLVSRSLDGLNEKIETNKIQTDTNKTNIATLQGDVTLLKQDNQTTKTTIAGLVSADTTNKANIAKNTQDIENLSAVMPTDINVDANGYAILEHDGTEITGQKKQIPVLWNYHKYLNDTYTYWIDSIIPSPFTSKLIKGIVSVSMTNRNDASKSASIQANIYPVRYNDIDKDGYFRIEIDSITKNIYISNLNNAGNGIYLVIPYSYTSYSVVLPKKDGTIALTSDLDAKQETLYRHTVKISKPTDDGKTSITFTASSEKNTTIDSIQDLTTVFGNTDLSVSGATFLISSSQWEFYNKIHVGTSINDTTVDYINKDDVGTYNFIDMFGTTGFTITDSVTAM